MMQGNKNAQSTYLTVFTIFSFVFLLINGTGYISLNVIFLLVLVSLLVILKMHLVGRDNIAISSYLVFSYIFFFVAPLIQIGLFSGGGGFYPNTLYFSLAEAEEAAINIVIFNSACFIFLMLTKMSFSETKTTVNHSSYLPIVWFYLFLSVLLSPFVYMLGVREGVEFLLLNKFLYFIPLLPALYFCRYNKQFSFMLAASLILIVLFKNPMTEKRNALGPIYLTIMSMYFFNGNMKNHVSFSLLLTVMLVVFPIAALFTHNKDESLEYFLNLGFEDYLESIVGVFNQLHYDAFSNLIAASKFVEDEGFSYGGQLAGAILFFIPRTLWPSKPLSSGEEIGEFLSYNYHMWFTNLSMPLIGEGVLNFGVFGVVIFALFFVFFIRFFEGWLHSKDFLKVSMAIYFSYHLIFLLRGDLMNGVSYFVGPFLMLYFIPRLLMYFNVFRGSAANGK